MDEEDKDKICFTCRFWELNKIWAANNPGVRCKWGFCHRYPPTIQPDNNTPYFPDAHENSWCGEWKQKDE